MKQLVGAVLRVGEPDYMYGQGLLILRVTRVGELRQLNDGQWLELEGYELRADGVTQVRDTTRTVLVRATALARQARTQGGA